MLSTAKSGNTLRLKYSCKFPACTSGYYVDMTGNIKNKHFYKFPKETKEDTLKQWKSVCRVGDDVNCTSFSVCEDHFLQKDFVNHTRHRLNYGVVPKHLELVPYNPCNLLMPVSTNNIAENRSVGLNEISTISQTGFVICNPDLSVLSDVEGIEVGERTQSDMDEGEYNFLSSPITESKSKCGVLGSGVKKSDLTPKKSRMYTIHRNTTAKLAKLKKVLRTEREELRVLKDLYEAKKFQFIEESLNEVSKSFINAQLRNANKAPSAMRWTVEDKVMALSIYKRGPRLYRYLATHFYLPSVRLLKSLLSRIPFDTGLNPSIVEVLKVEVSKMSEKDKYCALLFDEMSLEKGLYYEANKQRICGYEDLGHLGRSPVLANHALVFMIRGIHRTWKQIIAYYFTTNSVSSVALQQLIVFIITKLQQLGLKVVCTVCDQGSTNQKALRNLCGANLDRPSPFHFVVNSEPIVVIFDVPHLLKNTRNALIENKIQLDCHKEVKFEYIERVFNIDQEKRFKTLPKLKKQHFNFQDSYVKMKVKVAAAQLSHTVAAVIETYVATQVLPSEAIYTAEFVEKIDNLLDSLNSCNQNAQESKMYRCALSGTSPHIEFWNNILKEIGTWKIIDLKTGRDKTSMFSFIEGWQITIRSVIFLWNRLKKVGFKYLNLKALNQDPLENAFCCIRQHGISNTNPTCFQFVAALKTCIVNNMALPFKTMSNCESDDCFPLSNLCQFLKSANDDNPGVSGTGSVDPEGINYCLTQVSESHFELLEDSQAATYVAGYILKVLGVNNECDVCKGNLYSADMTESHLFTSFKENSSSTNLQYASEQLKDFLLHMHDQLYIFLEKYGHTETLEDSFKVVFSRPDYHFCRKHCLENVILKEAIPFLIYKYVKDCKNLVKRKYSAGHAKKVKKFKSQ